MANKIKKIFEIESPLKLSPKFQVSENPEKNDETGKGNRNFAFWVLTLGLLFLFLRTFQLQIIRGAEYQDIAEENRVRIKTVKAPRGLIRDAYGETLVQNVPSFDAIFIPAYLSPDPEKRKAAAEKFAQIIQEDFSKIEELLKGVDPLDQNAHLVKENIDYDTALLVVENSEDLEGFDISKTAQRKYTDGETFSHVIGYDGKITQEELLENPDYLLIDNIGKNGLEHSYEKFLHGRHGFEKFEVDSRGHVQEDLEKVDPIIGDELILHLDAALQRKVTEVLKKILEENSDATGAAAVAINPQNGGVRALVSLPAFDNNLFSGGIAREDYASLVNNSQKPLLNRAIGGEYPPGSTFKPMIATAALSEGVITEHTIVNCSGGISVGAWRFPDWKTHGPTDVRKAIAQSCDVFFYTVGGGNGNIGGLGINRISSYGRSFGFGRVLGVDLPGEANGLIPDQNWKFRRLGEKWYIGDSYHASIGQGYVLATPIQLASMTSAIANGGTLFRPQLADQIIFSGNDQTKKIEPFVIEDSLGTDDAIRIVREGMRQTVAGPGGSGVRLNSLKVQTAGKTGTAQFGTEEKTHSWYVSFGPYENPELAMVVLIEGGGEGHDWAVPASYEIYKWYFDEERGAKTEEEVREENNAVPVEEVEVHE